MNSTGPCLLAKMTSRPCATVVQAPHVDGVGEEGLQVPREGVKSTTIPRVLALPQNTITGKPSI